MMYQVSMSLTAADGTVKKFHGTLTDEAEQVPPEQPPQPEPEHAIDFTADFSAHIGLMETAEDWDRVFASAISQGVDVHCQEQNTGVTKRQFTSDGTVMRAFMPEGSYGMGYRSVVMNLGKVQGPVNVSFNWMCPDPGTNLWVNGGGKWGPAIQYGPVQSGSTGGIRFMPIWPAGASTLGKQDLTVAIQNQPDGGQWLQPPYYGFRPIEYNHWYDIHLRMIGGSEREPNVVECEYWKDSDPVMKYTAATTNQNAQQGKAEVSVDWTCFFGGGAANSAPADCYFHYRNLRVWVE